MSMKKKPTGFIAVCQCGACVGALDYARTDRQEAGKILGAWLHEGCSIVPAFSDSWGAKIRACQCDAKALGLLPVRIGVICRNPRCGHAYSVGEWVCPKCGEE